ncbi:hypothetical protein J3R82DRAFT_1194 [Butyriboletus roseoflavus]|nr:hypothetical protein J3R82DRAFT_1194 [Butyriboletus roseoflavus]
MESDDFFSNVSVRRPARSPDAAFDTTHDDFAHAISLRFGHADLRTAHLLPGELTPNQPHPPSHPPLPSPLPLPPPPPSPSPPQPFSSVPPSALPRYLADPCTLILDIRPHAAHAAARINHALSLSVPTTLLKRPLFSLSKLSQMLPSPSSRARFADWSSASCILVYDTDSASSPDNSIIAGLLRKFRAEGFIGELGWVSGGFQAVWRDARQFATTEPPTPDEDDTDPASSSGALRTTHLPKAAFSLFSTTAAPPQLDPIPGSHTLPNTPAPSASRAANPFFDAIRQNVELSHGITERIPLRLPRRVRRRINDLPFRWLQDVARRSALRHSSATRHPGLDSLESGSESSDDPHTSDPDENDPNVEEGTEALAMQFYRIELAEQRRLRSVMEHHTRESQVTAFASSTKSCRNGKGDATVGARGQGGVSVQTGAKSVPGSPHRLTFPFSITAGVEKGTKNRYTHIWPFEHARVRLHDGRHQGSHPGKRDKGRGRSTKDQEGGKGKGREEEAQDKQRRSRSSPAFGKNPDQEVTEVVSASLRHSFYSDAQSSVAGTSVVFEAGRAHLTSNPSPSVPRVQIEYDVTEQDSRMSGSSTPATVLPLATPPFYTPMETPVRARPPQAAIPPFRYQCESRRKVGRDTACSAGVKLVSSRTASIVPTAPTESPGKFIAKAETVEQAANDIGTKHDLRTEPSPVDDYVNASYVQPLCTRKRYIATQGPLPSTFVDFWTLVWEQNVHVIVMLTREVENAMVKCGSYWTDTEYGPLRLELLSTSPPMSSSANPSSMDISTQGFFAIREPQGKANEASRDQPTLITRTFAFSHTSYPRVPPRRITHLQYLDWSDMNVPDDPRGVLDLINKVEQAVAESTPGPSPSGSLSPGIASGSQSPDAGSDQMGYDTSSLSPTSAGVVPGGGRRRGNEWRHPELDSQTGIAAFALGKASPVLLHCSAGVGRTGGFIAVDAVLDGIRREVRKRTRGTKEGVKGHVESTETGINTADSCGEDSISDESGRMDVDEPTIDKAERTLDPLHMINTVPIRVSAGDRTKGRRRHYLPRDPSGEKQCSSSESLVVHVPYAGTDDVPEGTNVTGIDLGDPKEAGWRSSSTQEGPPSLSFPPSSRGRSPGSTSNSSGLSMDDSMNGSASANASGSASGSGSGNKVERKRDTGRASGSGTGSGNGGPPPSSVSKPGSGSISLSNSGSGTGTSSRFGSSLLRARLLNSSVTSISAGSTDSSSPEHKLKSNAPFHRPSVIHTNSISDMEIDSPPRPVSVPLQPACSSTASLQRTVHSRHHKAMLGSSPVASFSSPILPPAAAKRSKPFSGGDAAEGSPSRPNSGPGSGESPSPPQEFGSGESADAEGSGRDNQVLSDESEELAVPTKLGSNLRLNTELSYLNGPETLYSSSSAMNPPLPTRETQGREEVMLHVSDDSTLQQFPAATGVLGTSEQDQRAADHPIIDYKLPRELHNDSSPPLISSFAAPVCIVIQDMREQRMSLCQSLRQYVFVHAAIIEGALRIVDEERELWGYSGSSDDASSAEGEPGASLRKGGQRSGHSDAKTWFGVANEAKVADTPHRTRPLHTIAQPPSHRTSEGNTGGGQVSLAPTSSSSGVSSPPKGKRGPSPTELLREDKSGALSSNKRPSIHREMSNEGDQFSFESSKSSPDAGENGGGSRDMAVGVNATRSTPGRLAVPEKGGLTSGGAR